MTRVLLYIGFAAVATALNLAVQRLVIGQGQGIWPAMVLGTAVGLLAKYILDKRWIFEDRSRGLAAHGQRFGLYSVMGVLTTLIFWATEYAFWHFGQTEMLREIGSVLGLILGYSLKYSLDRRFVFGPKEQFA